MQPVMCSRCKQNVAVIFITKIENGAQTQEGLCLKCARELNIKPVQDIMNRMGISEENLEEMSQEMMNAFGGAEELPDAGGDDEEDGKTATFPFLNKLFSQNQPEERREPRNDDRRRTQDARSEKPQKHKFLDAYCISLTAKAREGRLDRMIGRDEEMERVIQILNRRQKNNPCLIGEPGVGKTAIAEGLAQRIVSGDVPYKLRDKEIYLLDLTALVAGTQFRGQFESRMKGLIEEIKKIGNIILVIDEVHTLVGVGDAEGSMNAANILKPALSRGEIQVIGATTFAEYRKHIEKDSALERRFQPVTVSEPSIEDSIAIIKGIAKYYEDYHELLLSGDKAQSEEDYQRLAALRGREMQITGERDKLNSEGRPKLSMENLARIIELWTKIPAASIKEDEHERLAGLSERLKKHIVGQDEAVEAVTAAIKRNRMGISPKHKPVSFIFVGSTGVGKTELVKRLAEDMFSTPDSLIRIDMSEYMEKHAVSRLVGSPPGYVGYDEAGQLTEKIRRKPYSVVLFDEIEKAHPDVMNILLQILDDGRITDAHGRTVNFENTIIIMTTNAGSELKGVGTVGFGGTASDLGKEKALKSLRDFLRPEFINRVDEIVYFNKLSEENFKSIAALMLTELKDGLSDKGLELTWDDSVIEYLVKKSYSAEFGARNLRRTIQKDIEDKIASELIDNYASAPSRVGVSVINGEIRVIAV